MTCVARPEAVIHDRRLGVEGVSKRERCAAETGVSMIGVWRKVYQRRWEVRKKGHASPDCRHKWGDSEDLHRTFHVVGKNVQAHLGTHAWNRLGEKVCRSHPGFDRAKWMLGGLAAYPRCLRSAIQSPLLSTGAQS